MLDFLSEEQRKKIREKVQTGEMGEEELKAFLIAAFKDDIASFSQFVFREHCQDSSGQLFDTPQFHKEIWDLLFKNKRVAIAAPRGHAKSTTVSLFYVIHQIVYQQKKFIVLISASEELATRFLRRIKNEFEGNLKLKWLFGDLVSSKWAEKEIKVKGDEKFPGTLVMAMGRSAPIRGLIEGASRPDLVCHEKGTLIEVEGEDMLVENHPTARERICEGLEIRIHGLPYTEVVTPEHRYWVRQCEVLQKCEYVDGKRTNFFEQHTWSEDGWEYAKKLNKFSWIGNPINQTVQEPEPIDFYLPIITERNKKGHVVSVKSTLEKRIHPWFEDDEFWWLIGYWWGDGSLSGTSVILYVADKDRETVGKRIEQFLIRKGKTIITSQKKGCYLYSIPEAAIARWLRTWKRGNSMKHAPKWVTRLDTKKQKNIVRGYIDADGYFDTKNNQVRLTSVYYLGLLQIREICARMGIVATIRHGIEGVENYEIVGVKCKTQKKYCLRISDGAEILGFPVKKQTRYKLRRAFIADGFLWSKVYSASPSVVRTFIPIDTPSRTYKTAFGLSHNCIDDVEDDEQVRSKLRRDDLRDWFDSSVMPGLSLDGQLVIIGTILHEDSQLSKLLNPDIYPEFISKRFSAIQEDGTALWEQRISLELLEQIKQSYVLRGQIDKFSAEYLNDPVAKGDEIFKKEYFQFFDEVPDDVRYYITIDAAISLSNRSDYTALIVIAWSRDNKAYVVDYVKKRMEPLELIELIFEKYAQYRPLWVGIEDMLATKTIKPFLEKAMRERGKYLPIKYLKISRGSGADRRGTMTDGKYQRIIGLEPLFKTGAIYMRKHMTELQEELLLFPKGKHDDLIDSLAMNLELFTPQSKHDKIVYKRTFSTKLIPY